MKIGMKEYLGVADRMALLVWGLRACSKVIAREARQKPECTYLHYMVARSE